MAGGLESHLAYRESNLSIYPARLRYNCYIMFPGQHNGFLLGYSGYPCLRFLMTPILHPASPAEERFYNSLCYTRVLVEQTFGILKRRFQCLHSELRIIYC